MGVGIGGNLCHVLLPSLATDIRGMVSFQEHVPRVARHATAFRSFIAILVQLHEGLVAAASLDACVHRIAQHLEDLSVARNDRLYLAPVFAMRYHQQLKTLASQVQVELHDAGKTGKIVKYFLHGTLDSEVGMLFQQRSLAAN